MFFWAALGRKKGRKAFDSFIPPTGKEYYYFQFPYHHALYIYMLSWASRIYNVKEI